MRTSRITIGVLTLIIAIGVSLRIGAATEQMIVPLVELDVNAGLDVLPSAGEVDALLVQPDCDTIGGLDQNFPFGNSYRGNRILMTDTSELTRIQMDFHFFGQRELHFAVHEQCVDGDLFRRVGESIVVHQGNEENDFTRRTYSSDVFAPPVPLFAGCTYAFGVAWGEEVRFFIDSRQYPTENDGFQDGDILGSTFIFSGPPIPESFDFQSGLHAYLMHLCLEPKPGACCVGGGACEEKTQENCEREDGIFTAERFTCDDLNAEAGPDGNGCPLVAGGCCLPGGGCLPLDRFSCENEDNAGTWHTDVCLPDGFPCVPRGACCSGTPNAPCTNETELGCNDIGGEYQGDDTNCTENGLLCNKGACCVGELCAELTEAGCADSLGIWQASGSTCDDNTCDLPGACCLGDTCEDALDGMNAARCDAAGGVYQGDFSTCDTLPAACGVGACCAPGIGCFPNLTQNTCENTLGGVFGGDGTACETLAPQCAGTCCWVGGCLSDTPGVCSKLNGVFTSYTACPGPDPSDPDPCENPPVSGGCCLPDGSCVVTTAAACTALGSTNFNSGIASCVNCDAPVLGACCLEDGRCAEITEGQCTANSINNVFNLGQSCTVELCAVGVCCHDNRNCDELTDLDLTIAECTAHFGDFYAERKTCEICPKTGACCLPAGHPAGSCDERTQGSCEGAGGQFNGEETVCPPDATALCALAACCQDDGTCRDTIEALCDPADHDPSGFLCVVVGNACPAAEACCLPVRRCDDLTPDACRGVGGTPQNPDTVCDGDTCTEGACCVPGEPGVSVTTCVVDLTIDECGAQNGIHQGVATDCTVGETCTEGACCVDGEPCQDNLTINECTDLGGIHQDISTDCTDADLCTEGACCPDVGDCEVLTIESCLTLDPPGTHRGVETKCETGGLCTEGTCCLDGERICARTEEQCRTIGGTHLGVDALCDGAVCLQGACCENDGTCRDDIVFDQCRVDVGIFRFGETCATMTQPCAPAGACCADSSNCSQLTEARCIFLERTYFDDGLLCDGGSCPGACCFEGGNCLAATGEDCDNGSGEFGPGETCETIDVCGGSCCHTDGTCQFVSEQLDCGDFGDLFSPDQTCEQAGCEVRGACCTSGGCSPEPVTESACTSGGGLYLGDSSICDASLCEQGACCRLDGTCEDGVYRVQCSRVHDDFRLAECRDFECAGRAACCVTGEPCQVLTEAECDALAQPGQGIFSEFGVPGTNCDDASTCIVAPCCLAEDKRCAELPRSVCERDGGVYRDDLTTCELVCSRTGEPCVDDDACRTCEGDFDTSCTVDGDCPVGVRCIMAQLCVTDECTRGACCDADGTCADDQYGNDCTDFADVFFMGNVCNALDDHQCAPRRACCTDGTCAVTTSADCVDGGGVFSDLRDCRVDGDLCEIGACCDSIGGCTEDRNGQDCAFSDGTFQGGGKLCEEDPTGLPVCHACCTGDQGSCVNAIRSVCDGNYNSEAICSESPSPGPCAGACCDNGQCTIIDVSSECAGRFLGNDTSCDPDLCDWGACCGRDGICMDRVIESACDETNGFFRLGVDCGLIPCNLLGACCGGGQCTRKTAANCNGVFQGELTECETETCVIGSCCAGAGGCSDSVVASQCAALGDVFRPRVDCAQLSCVPLCGMADLTGIVFADDDPVAPLAVDQPGNCAIDAREPHDINNVNPREGWNKMIMTFSCGPLEIGLTADDFSVSVTGGVARSVSEVAFVPEISNRAFVILDDTITPGEWTCIAHNASGGEWCMGYLPADASQNRTSNAVDMSALIDSINLVALLPIYATDINRSGVTTGADILRLIDLLNGAGDFDPWITQSLPPCPAP